MKKIIWISLALCLLNTVNASTMLTGAGSSFVYPLMSTWTHSYYQKTKAMVNYQSIGSAGGLNQLRARTVAFSAADIPLKENQLKQSGWIQFPVVMGGIVPIINVAGIQSNQLELSGSILANIYMGKILYWDNAALKKLNPKLTLPHNRIISIHRADGSGTTYNFTAYLSAVSPQFHKTIGINTAVNWPGLGIGAKGNAGVANQVQQIKNSIGYVEYAYAKQSNLTTTGMQNKAHQRVVASLKSFAAGANHAPWNKHADFALMLVNQPGAKSWPILATTFAQLPIADKQYQAVRQFFIWAFKHGDAQARQLDYVVVPTSVKHRIYEVLRNKKQ